MKRIIVYLLSIIFFLNSYLFAYSSNPKEFVSELVNDAIIKLADKNLNKQEKEIFIEKVALENVDINALGLYTLGELRKSSNEEDISDVRYAVDRYEDLVLVKKIFGKIKKNPILMKDILTLFKDEPSLSLLLKSEVLNLI